MNARQYRHPEYGSTATNRYAFTDSPVTASTSGIVSPAQSTNIARPGSWCRVATRSLRTAYSPNRWQYCEYPYLLLSDPDPTYVRQACSSVKCRFARIDLTTRAKSGWSYRSDTPDRPSGNSPRSSDSGISASRCPVMPRSPIIFRAAATSRWAGSRCRKPDEDFHAREVGPTWRRPAG